MKDENEQLVPYKEDYDIAHELNEGIAKKLEFEEEEELEQEPEPEPAIEQPATEQPFEQKPINEVQTQLERERPTHEQLIRGENRIGNYLYRDIDIKFHLGRLNLHNAPEHLGSTNVKISNPIDMTRLNDNPWK